jgi:formylglycine-generating enzyme required for sulfatase activity
VHCPEGTAALGQHDCAPAIALVVARGHPAAPSGMVWIPGGTFRMGRGPRYTTVGAFFVDRTEVTASNYRRCVAAHVCPASTEAVPSASNDQPMANVSWHSAVTFCAWAGGRLPTEAEWELAARGVDGREEPWGEQRADCHLAQMQGCGDATVRVGSIRAGASPFSVLDLAGNVAEWTLDRWGEVLPAGSVRDPSGPREGDLRVVRGGSFVSDSDDVRATAREGVHPDEARFDVGFRCVRSAP